MYANGSAAAGGGGGAAAVPPMNPYLKNPAEAFLIVKTRTFNPPNAITPAENWLWKAPPDQENLIRELQQKFLFGADAIVAAPVGVYTWIVKRFDRDGVIMMIAAQPICVQEFGTLHGNLDMLTQEGTILAAGEFRKTPEGIVYNFQSGSYMKNVFNAADNRDAQAATLEALVRPYFPHGSTFNDIPIIEGVAGSITPCPITAPRLLGLGAYRVSRSQIAPPKPTKSRKTKSALNQGGGARRRRNRKTRRRRHRSF